MDLPDSEKPDPTPAALVADLYEELRAVAGQLFQRERMDHTLQPTAVVHEVYLKLSRQNKLQWESRLHFFNIAAAQIRRVLVDHARAHGRQKRGSDFLRVTFDESASAVATPELDFNLLALDDALTRLEINSPEDRQVVELKFFGGLTELEIAEVMAISERTVRRRWLFARTWLLRELEDDGGTTP